MLKIAAGNAKHFYTRSAIRFKRFYLIKTQNAHAEHFPPEQSYKTSKIHDVNYAN
jgi:hypothetical protein